jgi:hypothetical protein
LRDYGHLVVGLIAGEGDAVGAKQPLHLGCDGVKHHSRRRALSHERRHAA